MTKTHLLALLLLSLLGVCGCGGATPTTTPTERSSGHVDDATLGARHWQLVEATGAEGARLGDLYPDPARPIQLDFAQGRVSVSNACNRMSGSYQLTGERLSVGDVMQTEMACEEPRMRAEAAIGRVLRAGATLRLEGDVLVWATPTGETLRLRGEPTAEARYGGPGERVFLEVAPQRVSCSHPEMPDYRCLHVRELRYDENGIVAARGEWEVLYQEIEGFTHEPGVRTVLRLARHRIADPPADASSIAYVLDLVVESEIVGQ